MCYDPTRKILFKIYRWLAVHGKMTREFDSWVHRATIGDDKVMAYKEGRDYILSVSHRLYVKWDDGCVHCGIFHNGDVDEVKTLWERMESCS